MIEHEPFGPAGRTSHHAHPFRPQAFIADDFQSPRAGLDHETVRLIRHPCRFPIRLEPGRREKHEVGRAFLPGR